MLQRDATISQQQAGCRNLTSHGICAERLRRVSRNGSTAPESTRHAWKTGSVHTVRGPPVLCATSWSTWDCPCRVRGWLQRKGHLRARGGAPSRHGAHNPTASAVPLPGGPLGPVCASKGLHGPAHNPPTALLRPAAPARLPQQSPHASYTHPPPHARMQPLAGLARSSHPSGPALRERAQPACPSLCGRPPRAPCPGMPRAGANTEFRP